MRNITTLIVVTLLTSACSPAPIDLTIWDATDIQFDPIADVDRRERIERLVDLAH